MTDDRTWSTNNQHLTYRFNNGDPEPADADDLAVDQQTRARGWDAVFAQEQWTMGRLTLQGALRFDSARSWFPEQNIGPTDSCRWRTTSRRPRASTATRTSRRGWARRTTSSATAGRP